MEGDAGMPNSRVNLSSAAKSPAATRFAERTHAQTAPPPPIQTPEIRCDERFRFIDPQRVPLSVLNYAVLQDEQCVAQGMLDEQGQTQRHGGTSPASLSIAITAPSPALE